MATAKPTPLQRHSVKKTGTSGGIKFLSSGPACLRARNFLGWMHLDAFVIVVRDVCHKKPRKNATHLLSAFKGTNRLGTRGMRLEGHLSFHTAPKAFCVPISDRT